MKIIPVLDLMGGLVVHAKAGAREHYRPISTPLCTQAEPLHVIEALLSLHPFDTLYIADLDALMQHGDHNRLIHHLAARYPDKDFWVDQGRATKHQHKNQHQHQNHRQPDLHNRGQYLFVDGLAGYFLDNKNDNMPAVKHR